MSCGSIGPRNECFPMTIWFAAQATIVAADIRHVGNDNPDMIEFGSKVFPRTRSGKPCRSPATKKGRCRLHGGASGSGGPPGNRNGQYRHGERTKAAIAERQKFSALLKVLRAG
jgi:hypothetical protein